MRHQMLFAITKRCNIRFGLVLCPNNNSGLFNPKFIVIPMNSTDDFSTHFVDNIF